MKHLGDITKIKGDEAPVVDCVIGGSPCQDLSVAGKRAGLAGEHSGLYMEQIRIIKEMRRADELRGRAGHLARPRYMVWENVPGAFSSNGGRDFAAVIEEAIKITKPQAPAVSVPEKGWPTAGCIMGDKWSIAWRVLDAQFWGTSDKPLPQRRRRIALVADFGGQSAPEILFVRQSVSGDLEPSESPRKKAARDVGEGADRAGEDGRCYTLKIRSGVDVDSHGKAAGKGALIQTEKSATLGVTQDQYLFQPVAAVAYGIGAYHSNAWKSGNPNSGVYEADTAKTLDALNCGYPACNQGGMAVVQPVAYSIENHPADSRVDIDPTGKGLTLTSRMGTGGGNVPMAMVPAAYWDGSQTVGTLTANNAGGNQRMPDKENFNCIIEQKPIALDRAFFNQGKNALYDPQYYEDGSNPTLVSREPSAVCTRHIVRRLTPLECERLQGFPDGWTDIGEWVDSKGKRHTEADSPRYKALGNSIALPPWKWVLKRLCACYERDATMASLFDGIGGFPYIWEQLNGKGSCLWASEIEEFPMAVTKLRFGEE